MKFKHKTGLAHLLVALLAQSSGAYLLVQQQQPQQPQPSSPSQNLGFLPNGYNLAATSLAAPQQQQQQQQSARQLDYPLAANQPSSQAGDVAGSEPGAGNSKQPAEGQFLGPGGQSSGGQQQLGRNGAGPQPSDREAGPVFRFQGMVLNQTSVKLVWNLMSGYHADLFEIRYGPIPDTESRLIYLNGTARETTISNLLPNEFYQFKLQAFVDDQAVWKPLIHMARTPATSPPRTAGVQENRELTPLGVKAEAKSNSTIQLSWSEQERPINLPHSKRVNYIRYHHWEPAQSGAGNDSQANASTTATGVKYHYLNVSETVLRDNRIIIQKLKPATEYAFAVKTSYYSPDMKKLFVSSGYSMDTLARTFDLEPSPPRNFTMLPIRLAQDEGQPTPKLELTWAPPESPNGQLKGYVILYAHELNQPDDKWARIYVNDSNINNWFVANLRPGTNYYFKMRAVNQRGQSGDTETRLFLAPPNVPVGHQLLDRMAAPIPANNILMLIVICLIAILFVLFLVVSRLFCRSRSGARKTKAQRNSTPALAAATKTGPQDGAKLANGYGIVASAPACNPANASTVTARMGTLARRSTRQQASSDKPDFWISAMDQQQQQLNGVSGTSELKSNLSDRLSNGSDNVNMQAMVSIQRESPQQFTTQTTQLAPMLPEYRFASGQLAAEQQLIQQMQQQQQHSHYHTGHQFPAGALGFDQMDNATASALMTLSKRQQQQLQKYQIQFASAANGGTLATGPSNQAPSPHQQPPPPPPLNIEQQQAQQQQQQQLHNQPLYGTHGPVSSTRSLRIHRSTLYDPVSGSFVQASPPHDPPNYNSHLNSMLGGVHQQLQSFNNGAQPAAMNGTPNGSNTLQFHHPHSTSTLMSRRSTNTLRSFQSSAGAGSLYGQLAGTNSFAAHSPGSNHLGNGNNQTNNPPQLLQNHQAVINQLNDSTYPSMPLKHVSAVRPQIMSSLEDQIEMELAEKQAEQQHQQQKQQQHQHRHQQQQDQQS